MWLDINIHQVSFFLLKRQAWVGLSKTPEIEYSPRGDLLPLNFLSGNCQIQVCMRGGKSPSHSLLFDIALLFETTMLVCTARSKEHGGKTVPNCGGGAPTGGP